jgi:hypothetical protein
MQVRSGLVLAASLDGVALGASLDKNLEQKEAKVRA